MQENKQDLEGTVIALKANYIIVKVKYNQSSFAINNLVNSSKSIQLLCTKRNRLAYKGYSISVGDIVSVEEIDWNTYRGVINSVEPRKSFLNRPSIANFTDLFIVTSLYEPVIDFNQLSLKELILHLINSKIYKNNQNLTNLIFNLIESYFHYSFLNNKNLDIYYLYEYFIKKINYTNKFNLDIESLFLEFKYKVTANE